MSVLGILILSHVPLSMELPWRFWTGCSAIIALKINMGFDAAITKSLFLNGRSFHDRASLNFTGILMLKGETMFFYFIMLYTKYAYLFLLLIK